MQQTQIPQFPEPSWSTTKQSCYEACPRQYYFQSYASWQGWPKGSRHGIQENRHAYFWSKRETIPTWRGKLIHSAISRLLLGEPADDVSRSVSAFLRKQWRWSAVRGQKLREMGVDACTEPKQILLMEHAESEISDEIADDVEEKVQQSIKTFLSLEILNEFREISQREDRYSFVENPDSGFQPRQVEFIDPESGRSLVVWSMIDCAYEIEPGTCLVYDWKTGRVPPDAEEARLTDQLIVYGHYVKSKISPKPLREDVQVEAFELYLPEGKAFGGHISSGDLEDARDRVIAQAAKLLEVHELIRDQEKNACEATPGEGVCRHCSFRKMCDVAWKIEQ